MRKAYLLVIAGFCGCCSCAHAQLSSNIVGYINKVLYTGDNLVANQLSQSNNTLNVLFTHSPVPDGTTFTKWDSGSQQFLPASMYDSMSGWSINYELDYGEGGLIHTPAMFTNTFVGNVWAGLSLEDGTVDPPLISDNGLMLLSCVVPFNGATFDQVVGRDPMEDESVTMLDPASQQWSTTTFRDGAWDHGAPALAVGESAFFNLGPTRILPNSQFPVPEPAAWAILSVGGVLLAGFRRRFKSLQFS